MITVNLNTAGSWASIAGLVFALITFQVFITDCLAKRRSKDEKARMNQLITIELENKKNKDKKQLPVPLRRGELIRSEVLGCIGMIRPGERFKINYLNTVDFAKKVRQIYENQGEGCLTIPCENDEYDWFFPKDTQHERTKT